MDKPIHYSVERRENAMELFKINEIQQYKFIKIPYELFTNPYYEILSSDAKLIYGFLLDRMELSRENNWVNENGEIYLIFSREDIQNLLKISDRTCTKAFNQLNKTKLIYEIRQGLGKPNLIYIGHINYNYIPETLENPQNRNFYDSRTEKITVLESRNLRSNQTNINQTNINQTDNQSINQSDNIYIYNHDNQGQDIKDKLIDNEVFMRELKEKYKLSDEELKICLSRMNGKNIKNPIKFFETVVKNYCKNERGLLKDIQNAEKSISSRPKQRIPGASSEQRQYNPGELEKLLLGR